MGYQRHIVTGRADRVDRPGEPPGVPLVEPDELIDRAVTFKQIRVRTPHDQSDPVDIGSTVEAFDKGGCKDCIPEKSGLHNEYPATHN